MTKSAALRIGAIFVFNRPHGYAEHDLRHVLAGVHALAGRLRVLVRVLAF